jgi:hypothetical protein
MDTAMSIEQINMLLEIHTWLSNFPVLFRERVCAECNWSTPTFYRKMRATDKPGKEKGKINTAVSNAEKQKAIEILFDIFKTGEEMLAKYQKYYKSNKPSL